MIPLGRRHAPDTRDWKLRAVKRTALGEVPRYKMWYSPGVLDQGNTPQCVGYSTTKLITSGPVVSKPILTPNQLYHEAQLVDEWPGENYEGTSVRAAMKVLKRLEHIESYAWAPDLPTALHHLLTKGPVVFGTDWYMDMFTPDRWGYIWPTGEVVGGHAYCVKGASQDKVAGLNKEKGAVRVVNSWGREWAEAGHCWIAFSALAELLENWGEAAMVVEKKV